MKYNYKNIYHVSIFSDTNSFLITSGAIHATVPIYIKQNDDE